jgi:hypothetical protein
MLSHQREEQSSVFETQQYGKSKHVWELPEFLAIYVIWVTPYYLVGRWNFSYLRQGLDGWMGDDLSAYATEV